MRSGLNDRADDIVDILMNNLKERIHVGWTTAGLVSSTFFTLAIFWNADLADKLLPVRLISYKLNVFHPVTEDWALKASLARHLCTMQTNLSHFGSLSDCEYQAS